MKPAAQAATISNKPMAQAPAENDETFTNFSSEAGSTASSDAEMVSADEDFESESEEPATTTSAPNSQRQAPLVNAAEVRAAREASETFRSNVFKLQIDEVLKEISFEEKYAQQARKLLFSVREAIANTHKVGPLKFAELQAAINTRIPYPREAHEPAQLSAEIQYKFGYEPPQLDDIQVVGSWSLKTTVRRPHRLVGIDLYVPMANSLFDGKDNLDFRYHRKRAFFLAVLANQLAARSSDLHVEPRFETFNNHPLRPELQLVPSGPLAKLGKRVCIYIHTGPQSVDIFPLKRLQRHRNSNRAVEGPTPVYNWSVAADLCIMPVLRYLHATSAICPAFTNACKLGALWLEQRGWGSDPLRGGFGHFELTMLMASLLNGGSPNGKKRLLPGFSSYQLLKGTLLYLAESQAIKLEASLLDRNQPTTVSSEPGLYFADTSLDVLVNLASWAPALLRYDAQLAVDMLQDGTCDRFEQLFLQNIGSQNHLRFDLTGEIKLPAEQPPLLAIKSLHRLLTSALGDRVVAMQITPVNKVLPGSLQSSWSLASDPPSNLVRKYHLGLLLDASKAAKRVYFVGPEVDNSPENFKQLWGDRASLRRFQNGMIRDAVVWRPQAKPAVCEAVEFILHRHLRAQVSFGQPLERNLVSGLMPAEEVTAKYTAMATSFQKMGQALQEQRGALPLRILSVYGTSSHLRSASLAVPEPFVPHLAAEGVIELETSAKWPRDFEAAEKVKAAFLIKLAESLRQANSQYFVVIGLEPAHRDPRVESSYAIIQSPDGFYFKLRITSRSLGDTHLTNLVNHTQLITSMVHRYGAPLSTTMRLVKQWLENQMLMSHISEPAAELLALSVFVNSAPYAPPNSGTTGFWRVIERLSRWDWREQPLILDVDRLPANANEEALTTAKLVAGCDTSLTWFQSVMASFVKQRQQDPALTQAPWLISTKHDTVGTKWTAWEPRSRTAAVIAGRVSALARAARPGAPVFVPALADFDVSWTVHSPLTFGNQKQPKNIAVSDPQKAIIGAHNVSLDLVRALRQIYAPALVLFYSGELSTGLETEHQLCGIWNRAALQTLPKLKANVSYPLKLVDNQYVLDQEAVRQEIERLGAGMLTRR